MENIQDLFEDHLKDLYSAEKQILKALPKMIKASSHPRLRESFENHLRQTEEQVRRLEEVARMCKVKPTGKVCHGMMGLLEEGQELIKEGKPSPVMDAGLIGAAQKVEHYEISGYGTFLELCKSMGMNEVVEMLKPTMAEEENTDKLLTQLAETEVNRLAVEYKPEMTGNGRKSTSSRSTGSKSGAAKSGARTMKSKVSVR